MNGCRTITAQVAAEAIANDPDGYDVSTIEAVLEEAVLAGVAPLYVDLVHEALEGRR